MSEWVDAVRQGRPVDDLIPVNVTPSEEWADELQGRLKFIQAQILISHQDDLKASSLGSGFDF